MKMNEIRKKLNVFCYLCSMFINEETWNFVRQHAGDDVRTLALQGAKEAGVDLTVALQQIAGWQTARRKLPSWAAVEGMVYPPHLNMEQCSSEQTARYKAGLVGTGDTYVDLTGGFGVDFYFMSQAFSRRIYVEQSADLCAIVDGNMGVLGLDCSVCQGTASAYLAAMEGKASVIYLDPARRNEHGGRTYGIEDCSPNVLELLPLLMEKAGRVILKLSPMLDWHQAVEALKYVTEVHILSVANECKELVLVLEQKPTADLRLCCVNDAQIFEVIYLKQTHVLPQVNSPFTLGKFSHWMETSESGLYLYEPNASIMKAGCFAELAERYEVSPVAVNSHLFLSSVEIGDFPGRGFQVEAVSSMNKREINQKLTSLKSANISVRNFPLTANQLRKKLKLKDGGDVYIFATTVGKGEHKLFICRKIS